MVLGAAGGGTATAVAVDHLHLVAILHLVQKIERDAVRWIPADIWDGECPV
jgi:hypothetical protein